MLLDAKTIKEDLAALPHWDFVIKGPKQCGELGHIFAQAVLGMQQLSFAQERALRLGLKADFHTGKSTFAGGILSAFTDKQVIESNCSLRPQYSWACKDRGWIRYYDAVCSDFKRHALKSYFNRKANKLGYPFIDIVEHPEEDRFNTKYDCLILLKRVYGLASLWGGTRKKRKITVVATPELAGTEGFQKFLRQARHFANPSYDLEEEQTQQKQQKQQGPQRAP